MISMIMVFMAYIDVFVLRETNDFSNKAKANVVTIFYYYFILVDRFALVDMSGMMLLMSNDLKTEDADSDPDRDPSWASV